MPRIRTEGHGGRRHGGPAEPFTDLVAELEAVGYQRRFPTVQAVAIDAGVCADAACAACGHEGLIYVPLIRSAPYSYRAFAVCPVCTAYSEF